MNGVFAIGPIDPNIARYNRHDPGPQQRDEPTFGFAVDHAIDCSPGTIVSYRCRRPGQDRIATLALVAASTARDLTSTTSTVALSRLRSMGVPICLYMDNSQSPARRRIINRSPHHKHGGLGQPAGRPNRAVDAGQKMFNAAAVYGDNDQRCSPYGCRCVYPICKTTRQSRPALRC